MTGETRLHLKTCIVLLLIILQTATVAASCLGWFFDQHRSPSESKEACELGCASSPVDMGTFYCTNQCGYFCKNRRCKKVWSEEQKEEDPCKPITAKLRTLLLSDANPSHFLKVRYQSPPATKWSTDCSHFVNQIYKAVGLVFPYQSTSFFDCITHFESESASAAKIGDIVLFAHHVGIYSGNGRIISATIGGPRRLAMLDPNNPLFRPSIQNVKIAEFNQPVRAYLAWSCDL